MIMALEAAANKTSDSEIGSYGVEVKDVVTKVEGLFLDTLEPFTFTATACAFGYRTSLFKTELKDKTLITKVFFTLSTNPVPNTTYGQIEEELLKQPDRSIQSVRNAVINIRSQKLPDPAIFGNAGSFFKNPTVPESLAFQIRAAYPHIPLYQTDIQGFYKLPAAFLIDQCGWKGVRKGNVGVHINQPLVLLAFEGATGAEVLHLSQEIQNSVQERFGVTLEREANVV